MTSHHPLQCPIDVLPIVDAVLLIGALGGFLVGNTPVDSDSFMTALLVMQIILNSRILVGAGMTHALPPITASVTFHRLSLIDVLAGVAGLLLFGSVPGVLIGSRLSL